MQLAYYTLPLAMGMDYETQKAEILVHCGLCPTNATAEFHKWSYHPAVSSQAQMDSLLCTAKRWLQTDRQTWW